MKRNNKCKKYYNKILNVLIQFFKSVFIDKYLIKKTALSFCFTFQRKPEILPDYLYISNWYIVKSKLSKFKPRNRKSHLQKKLNIPFHWIGVVYIYIYIYIYIYMHTQEFLYLSDLPPSQIWHKVILLWRAMHGCHTNEFIYIYICLLKSFSNIYVCIYIYIFYIKLPVFKKTSLKHKKYRRLHCLSRVVFIYLYFIYLYFFPFISLCS